MIKTTPSKVFKMTINLKMDLYSLNDEHCLQPEDYCNDGFQPMCDILQPELSDRSSGSATTMFSDNLGRIEESLPSADMMSSVNNKWDADLGLIDAEDSVLLLNKPCKEKVTALDCKVCRKVFYNASSLSKHMVTHSEKRNHICRVCKKAFKRQDHLMGHMLTHLKDIGKESVGISQHKVEPTASTLESGSWTTKRTTVGQLVIPVSVPFSETDQQKRETVITHTTKKGKKKSSCPKSLYIPPPVVENTPTSSGSFQSTMRSPHTPLSDLLNGALQHQYTPPPMLSPIRRGTGLYFNTFCSASSAKYQPPSLIKKETGEFFFVKDNIEFSVQPHINIGDQFQAVIPECRDQLGLEREEEKADLVWRPCLDNEAMSNFVNLACSSAVPGGGHNLELGLHCLYFSQGNILEALDKLLVKGPLKLLLPRCLANYHYAGSDHWSAAEKRQFKKAYSKEGKDFSYIQSMIPGKSVHQCVEYYYTWKTILSFERRQTPEQTLSAEQSFSGEEPHGKKEPHTGVKVKSKKQKKNGEPKGNPPFSQNESRDGEYPIKFVCPECNRVFEKVKSRNAHMKIHRLQEQKR
ncbi:zinc finger protein 541 isoform X3 [Hyla sarda]|uniref:zinc finger protein 541 isoform X3 n=1 Tax=Hyla sarda TaxID=327740 RepID=UPI0024C31196|nr:zinc finger protein 541 isoform X3 [Hyla sarda]